MDSCLGCPLRDRTLPAYYRFQYDRQKLARFSLLHLVWLRPQERPVDLKRYVIDGSRTSSISPWALIHWDAKQLAITCRSSVFLGHQWGDHLHGPPIMESLFQSVQDEAGMRRPAHPPADDPAGIGSSVSSRSCSTTTPGRLVRSNRTASSDASSGIGRPSITSLR
jgi:hypothetical protein